MINLKLTKNMLGINLEGDFDDLNELSKSLSNISSLNQDIKSKFETISIILDSLNSNIRSALLGDKDIILKDNGLYEGLLAYKNMKAPLNNVYFSFNISIIDMLFIMITGNKFLFIASHNEIYENDFLRFIYDSKIFEELIIKMWNLLNELDINIDKTYSNALLNKEEYEYYLLQYIDKLFIDLYNSKNRKEELINIINKIINKTNDYINFYNELDSISKEYNISICDVTNDYLDNYPLEFEW